MIENAIIVALVMALCEAIKPMVESKWIPLVAVGLGAGLAFLVPPTQPVPSEILEGAVSGLVAVGIYSGTKNTFKPTE